MPFFKIDNEFVYYAHVPKCGGSSIANYLRDRFGPLAFYNTAFHNAPPARRWTRSSPQHVDAATFETLVPMSYFSAAFAFVRHPVSRLVSCYHFQAEVEELIAGQSFSDWLKRLADRDPDDPFAFDNHVRPMAEIVPDGATIFHIEYGADQLIPWLDGIAGRADGPRAIPPENIRGQYAKTSTPVTEPTEADLALIAELYAMDFARFGYAPENKAPLAPKPRIDADFLADRDRALRAAARPLNQLKRKLRRKYYKIQAR